MTTTSSRSISRAANAGESLARAKGSKNLVTKETLKALIAANYLQPKDTVQDMWRSILGLEDPNPNVVDGKAVSNREKLKAIIANIGNSKKGKLRPTAAEVAILKLAVQMAYGLPVKMEKPKNSFERRMPYIGRHGLPWQYDVMFEQQEAARAAQKDQEKIDAQARQKQLQGVAADPRADEDDDEETLEIVDG